MALSDDAARAGMTGAGMPDFYADAMLELFRIYRDGGASQVTPHVRDITGREPCSLWQFVRDHADKFL